MTVEEAIKIKNYLNSGSKYKAQLVGKDGVFTDVDVDVVHGKVCAHVFNTQYGNSNSKADAVILDGDFSQELYERFEALRPGGGYLHIIDGGYEVDEYHPKFMEKVNEVIEGTDAA
ncbi:hypothetical protein A0181_14440 [Salmonella enterica]|nr:hypothetical protein [Salmonella enterica]